MAQRVAVPDGANKKTSRVRVAVRLRPYMDNQDEKDEGPCVRGLDSQNLEIINWRNATETVKYHFDAFHGEQTTQQEVFVSSVKPILPHILTGQNASVFAYGPTGAGKTHTMMGSSDQPGVIPRAVSEVFKLVKAKDEDEGWDYSIGMSYLEIYNEKVLDLLSPSSQDLPIREDKDKNILIPGLTLTTISSFSDFDKHFVPASLNRTTASTKLNQRSSRSHAVLLIKVVRTQRALPHRQQTGKLYLIDLAGSEDNRRTGNQGIRLKESGAINLSLFTLSKVVDSLNSGTAVRVPYRDSKLTRLLQDSLGGSAHSVMITNIAPEYKYYFDTFNALNFASKSKLIVNKPFTCETVAVLPVKRAKEDHKAGGSGAEPQKKRHKDDRKTEQDGSSPSAHFYSPSEPSVMDRLVALEKLMMNCQDKDKLSMLSVAQSRKEIQELKEKQREFESKAMLFSRLAGEKSSAKQEPAFTNNSAPLQRKQSTATNAKKQQAVVQPLQVFQPLQQLAVVKKQSVCVKKERKISDEVEPPDGKENSWESQLDTSVLEHSRQKILHILNTGSLKELKGLQQIGDKKAKLILGWREIHGHFINLEDVVKVEGMTGKRFSSFVKANILSAMGK
ncbi:kinesin-like protein KIF22 [Sander lucioperca]|uniref:Kinesin-like protein n=1 Tax=Sander lucioperca TaxID=283035 RepID=A0A8D0A2H2_SANLU|nr:kinesin-like protein KIF22 [Sander lucioperca]XP_031170985.1 kinesin-like protein KIF22 [Sander lucioperca]XP_031170986.1 kinesin-like protein KIF22 [Sander lucioperca]XP_031170987.1 kinesin-like protein KIF22 [Sander lucioperca]XP_035853122.1 kinesin-like protein KIF22 [Sander lucioperca]